MEDMTSAEIIEKITREKMIAEFYIMALKAEKAGKSLKEFVEELELKLGK